MKKDSNFKLRISEEELKAWKQEAEKQDKSAAMFVRDCVNYVIRNEIVIDALHKDKTL